MAAKIHIIDEILILHSRNVNCTLKNNNKSNELFLSLHNRNVKPSQHF